MARFLIERNYVNVVGYIWIASGIKCAHTYNLSSYDVRNIGEFTRENVELWLATHAGDFREILDFEATVGNEWIKWADEENEMVFNDCMFPCEED